MQNFQHGKTAIERTIFLAIGFLLILSIMIYDKNIQEPITNQPTRQEQFITKKQIPAKCRTVMQEIPVNCILLDEQAVVHGKIQNMFTQNLKTEWSFLNNSMNQNSNSILIRIQKQKEAEQKRQQEFIEAKRKEPQTLEAVFESEYTTLYELEPYLSGSYEEQAELVQQFLRRDAISIKTEEEEKRLTALQQAFETPETKITEVISLLKGKYEDNLWLLSHLMRGESLELTDEVQQAQAWVAITRAIGPLLSDGTGDLANAIFRGRQYTCVWDGSFWQEVDEQCIRNAENYLQGELLEPEKTLNGYFIGTAPENKHIVSTYEVQNWEEDAQNDIVIIYICDRYYF